MEWKSVCGAVQGRGHAKKDIPCQDKAARREANGVHVIALADGAGSAALSHFGAQCVVNCVTDFVAEKFFDLIAQKDGRLVTQELLSVVLAALKNEAASRDCALKDLASTLLVAAVGGGKFFLAHLGDGVIGYLNEDGLKVATTPDNGEFSNETVFVTSTTAAARMRIFKGALKNISGFILMSDGSEQSLYNKRNKTLAPAVKRLMHRTTLIDADVLTPQLERALSTVVAENTHDDCSVAILARNSEQLPPLEDLPLTERLSLFQIAGSSVNRKTRKKILRCDEICALLKRPLTLRRLSRRLRLKPLHAKKKLGRLLKAGVLRKDRAFYETVSR